MNITQSEMRAELKRQVNAAGGLMVFCRKHDLLHPNVSAMIRGERQISEAASNACGFIVNPPTYKKFREAA